MASVDALSTGITPKNSSNFEVITLSSDEEESVKTKDNISFLFSRFLLACRPHVTKEAIKDARQIFKENQGSSTTRSPDLADLLARYAKEIRQANAVMYLDLICKAMGKDTPERNGITLNSVDENDKVEPSGNVCDVINARNFEHSPKPCCNDDEKKPSTKLLDIPTLSIDDDDFVSKKPSKQPTEKNTASTSRVHQDANVNKAEGKGKISTKNLSKKQKRILVARLKQRLKEISNEIKILNRAELTLEEMEMCDSTYIKEHRLKKSFEKVWNKLCKILGRAPNTGRVTEKPVRASSTGYSMIDKAIAKFLKEKQGSFPDFFDVRDVVLNTNQKHDLRMSPQVLNGIIADIFTDIGNKLQRQRERDLLFNFGSHLLDDFKTEEDPALSSEELARQLEKNRKISKRNLKHVYAKYTHLERYEIDDRTRKPGSARLQRTDEDINGESGTSDDDGQRSKYGKYTRLDQSEVKGKSKKNSSRPGSSRAVHEDISSESSTSEDEQDLSRTENDDSIMVDDSDLVSSQEYISMVAMTPVTDMSLSNVEPSDTERTASPIFPLSCPVIKEDGPETSEIKQTMPTTAFEKDLSNDDTRRYQTLSASSDCEIINDSKDEVKQQNVPAKVPSGCEDKQETTDDDCLIIDNDQEPSNPSICHEESKSKPTDDNPKDEVKQLDDVPAKEPVNEPEQPTTDDDCLIIDNDHSNSPNHEEPKCQPTDDNPMAELKQLDDILVSEAEQQSTDDDCLIVDNSQEPSNSPNHEEPTSTDDLTMKFNALRAVFQQKCDTVIDKSKQSLPSTVESTEPGNSVSKPASLCSSKVGIVRDNIEDLAAKPKVSFISDSECLKVVSNADVVMSDHEQSVNEVLDSDMSDREQSSTLNVLKGNTSVRSTNSSSPRPETNQATDSTSNLCHSPSNPSTETERNVVNPRKRKATTELTVNIPKSTVKCLEKIAQALKNKRLKLPEAWINPKKAENTVSSSTTSKDQPATVTWSPSENKSPTLPLVKGKAKINFQQRQVFREKTLNALKVPTKPVKSIENGTFQPTDVTSSNRTISSISLPDIDNEDEVIIIDD